MGNADRSKRLSRQILAQAALLAVMGISAKHAHAAATDTWVGPYTDVNNNSPGSNWATATNWSIFNGSGGQTLPVGGSQANHSTDALVVNENDANAYQIYYDQLSLSGGVNDDWFNSLTAGNAGVGSVNFNLINGSVINFTNAGLGTNAGTGTINFTNNSSMNVGIDGQSFGIITATGAVTFSNNSSLNVSNTGTFSTAGAGTFSNGSSFTLSMTSSGSAQTVTFSGNSTSTFNVLTGSTFNTTAGAVFTGSSLGTQGMVNVTGSSVFNVGGGNSAFGIGSSGYATATIDSSSKLTAVGIESSSADDFFGGMQVGESFTATTSGGILNTAGTVTNTGRLYIGDMSANHLGTGAATTAGASGLVSMTGGTWTNGGNVLIGIDASSAGNGTATGAVAAFGLAHGELDISGGGVFTVATGKQVYVGASSATGILNVSGGSLTAPSLAPLTGIQVGAVFDMLANTAGAGVDGTDDLIPGTGTFLLSGTGVVNTTSLTVGAGSSVIVSGGTLTLTSLIVGAGSTVNLGGGTVNFISSGSTGPSITLNGGSLSVSGNQSAVALNLNASTNFTGVTGGGTQQFGVLNFGGDTTVTSTYGGTGTDVLSFTGVSRAVGVTGNFVSTGGTNGVNNSIVLTGQPTGFISQGIFFGGGNYAWYDAGGFVRGIAYGSDPGAVTTGATTSVAGTYVQTTGAVSAETTNVFTTLAITGAFNFSLAGGATLTVNGIDKSGTGASVISGGTGIQAGNNAEMVVRSDSATDSLTISSSILANGTNVLTKTGAGSLTVSGVNTYTGGTIITDGTLVDGSSTGLPSTGSITINPGGTLDLNSQTATIGGLTLAGGAFLDSGGGGSLSLNGNVLTTTSPVTFAGAISLSPASAIGATVRTFSVSGSNSVSDLTLSGAISAGSAGPVTLLKTGTGTLTLSGPNSSASFNTLEVTQGTLRIDGSTGTLTDGLVNLTLGTPGTPTSAGTFKYDNTTSSGARTNAMAALSFASGDGTVNSVQTAAQNVALTFSSISRTSGATGNLVVTNGTNGTTNKISIAGQPTGLISPGVFFNGSNFAYYDPSGYVRGINYGTDAGSVGVGTTTTGLSPTSGGYLQITGLVSTQDTFTTGLMLNTLVINGTGAPSGTSVGLEVGSHNVIQMINSIDKVDGGALATGNQGLTSTAITQTTLTPNADLVYRTDTIADILTSSAAIQGNGNNELIKSGAGYFVIGNNVMNYTGNTVVDGGTLTFNGTTTDGSDLNNSTIDYNNYGGVIAWNTEQVLTFGGLKGSQSLPPLVTAPLAALTPTATPVIAPVTLTIGGALDNQSNTYSGVLSGPGNIVKGGTGTWTLTAASTYTGTTNVSNGTLEVTGTGSLASTKLILGTSVVATEAFPEQALSTFSDGVTLQLDAGQSGANFTAGTTLIGYSSSQISASGITGTLAFGALNRSAGSAIDFGVLPTGSGSFTTSTSNGAGDILGAWATVNQTGWATVSGGTISALASYSPTFSGGADVDAPTGNSIPGTLAINSLRLNNTGVITLADSGGGDTLTVTSGGILETAGVGNNAATISVANLTSGISELIVDQSNTAAGLAISSNISGGIGVTKTGVGTLTLSGASSYTGPTTLANGILAITTDTAVNHGVGGFQFSSGTLQLNNYTSSLVLTNLPALRLGGATGSSTLAGNINGTSGLTYVGPGTLILSGNNTYTGATFINAGTLKAGSTTALGNTSTYTLANAAGVGLDITGFNNSIGSLIGGGSLGGNITLGSATLTVVGDQNSASYGNSPVYAGVISGLGGLTKKAGTTGSYTPGVLTLTGVNLYSGPTNLSGGVLAITADTGVNNGAGGFVFSGGTLQFNAYTSNLAFANLPLLNLGAAEGLVNSTLTGAITGSSHLIFVGPGTLNLAPSPSTANSYTGGTNLSAGTLAISADNALGSGGFQFSTGTLQFDNCTSGLNFASIANLKLGAAAGAASKLSGNITGTSPLIFAGPGTLQLTSTTSNYSGGTTVLGGTLQLGTSATLGNTSTGLTVNPGGTLDLNGTNLTVNALNGVSGTGFILNNNTSTNVTLTVGNGNTAGTFSGGIINDTSGTGTVALTKVGTVAETLSRADNTYTGITNISAGTLTAGAAGAFSPNSEVSLANVSGATLNVASLANTVGSLTGGGTGGGNVTLGTGVLTIGNDNTSPTAYAGVISSTSAVGGITKIGTGTLGLAGVNTYTGPTVVNGGTLEITPSGNVSAGATVSSLTVNATTGPAALKIDARTVGIVPINFGSVSLVAGGTITLGTSASHANRIQLTATALTNAGHIDLGGNDMIITNTTSALAGTTLAAVNGELASGFSGGTWAGSANGSIGSTAAAADTTHLTAIGSATGLTSFDGKTVPSTDVLLKYTYYGDADLSGVVDGSDYSRIDNAFLNNSNISNTALTGWNNGDFNYDGVINGSDYTLIDNAFNSQGAALTDEIASPSASLASQIAGASGSSSVPEPTSMALLGIATAGLLGRRGGRRRRH